MDRRFYEAVRDSDPGKEQFSLSVLSGPFAGEKALVSGGVVSFLTAEDGFFSNHRDSVETISENGVQEIDGTPVFAERLGYDKKLVICGAGHVAMPVIELGKMLGFSVTVIEERPYFANNARNAGADTVYEEDFSTGLSHIRGDLDTYFVVVTRGHQYDKECLIEIARKPYGYIGMMGSSRRVAIIREKLKEAGVPETVISDLHAPIGLSIGAETPEEIAVAILSEIISVKNAVKRSFGYPEELLSELLTNRSSDLVVATIVAKRGSAPRNAGTKMLVHPGGSLTGTIGGGCLEAGVVRYAEELLESEDPKAYVCHVDLADDAAAVDGMVCGGNVDVFLERV